MKYLKLFEDYSSDNANIAYEILLKTYSSHQLSRMGLGKASSDYDVRYLYYKECKKDMNKVTRRLAEWLAGECISLSDMEMFNALASEHPLQFTSMTAFSSLMAKAAFEKKETFGKRLLEILSYQPDGEERLKEYVKKLNTTDPSQVNSEDTWVLGFLFDEGIIVTDGSKKYPFNVAFYQMPTELLEKMGKEAKIDEHTVSGMCRQNIIKSIETRIKLYLKSPTFWKYLMTHPDDIDEKMGFGTFADYMPKDKAKEINDIRRGRLSGRKFGF
jgi:hypothetical protein